MPPKDRSLPDPDYRLQQLVPAEGVVLARVHGPVDYVTAPLLRHDLFEIVDSTARLLIVDLTAVTLLSAAAMEMLLAVDIHAGAQGTELRLIATNRSVLRPLAMAGLDERIRIFDTLELALHA